MKKIIVLAGCWCWSAFAVAGWCPQAWLKDCSVNAVWDHLAKHYAASDCHNEGAALVCEIETPKGFRHDSFTIQGNKLLFAESVVAVPDSGQAQDNAAIAQLKQRRDGLLTAIRERLGNPTIDRFHDDGSNWHDMSWWKGATYFNVISGDRNGAFYLVLKYRP